jgi:hypothetical protein
MITAQVELTEPEMERLQVWAQERGVSVREVIRQALEPLLRVDPRPVARETWERASRLVGALHSGTGDLGARHDDILAEAVLDE